MHKQKHNYRRDNHKTRIEHEQKKCFANKRRKFKLFHLIGFYKQLKWTAISGRANKNALAL